MAEVFAAELRRGAGLGFFERDPVTGNVADPEIRVEALAFDLAVGARPVFDEGVEAVELGLGVRAAEAIRAPLALVLLCAVPGS